MSDPINSDDGYFSDSADEWDAPIRGDLTDDVAPRGRPVPAMAAAVDGAGAGPRGYGVAGMSAEERELAGERVEVEFLLPSGQTWDYTFFMGHTVQYLKAQLEAHDKTAFPYDQTELYLDDRLLLDPLSLNDLPFTAERKNRVRVHIKA